MYRYLAGRLKQDRRLKESEDTLKTLNRLDGKEKP